MREVHSMRIMVNFRVDDYETPFIGLAMTRNDARKLARRINQCLEDTKGRE